MPARVDLHGLFQESRSVLWAGLQGVHGKAKAEGTLDLVSLRENRVIFEALFGFLLRLLV